jgi:hypothetical protein
VAEPGGGAGLAKSALAQLRKLGVGQPDWQNDLFDRDIAAQNLVTRQPHPPHATNAERTDQSVSPGKDHLRNGHVI